MKQTRVAIYARVSGNGQNPEMQIKELQTYCAGGVGKLPEST